MKFGFDFQLVQFSACCQVILSNARQCTTGCCGGLAILGCKGLSRAKQTYDATDFGLPDGTQRTSIYGAFVLAQGRTHFDDIF